MDRAAIKARLKDLFTLPQNGKLSYELKPGVEIVDGNNRGKVLYVIVPGLKGQPVKGLLDALSAEDHYGYGMFGWESAVINYVDAKTGQPRCCNPVGTFLPEELKASETLSIEAIRQALERLTDRLELEKEPATAFCTKADLMGALLSNLRTLQGVREVHDISWALKDLLKTAVAAEVSLREGYLK